MTKFRQIWSHCELTKIMWNMKTDFAEHRKDDSSWRPINVWRFKKLNYITFSPNKFQNDVEEHLDVVEVVVVVIAAVQIWRRAQLFYFIKIRSNLFSIVADFDKKIVFNFWCFIQKRPAVDMPGSAVTTFVCLHQRGLFSCPYTRELLIVTPVPYSRFCLWNVYLNQGQNF